jgi:hemoglobin
MSIKRTIALCVAALALAGASSADDAKKGSSPEAKELDQRIYTALRDVINTGAELYNRPKPNNDPNGCYRLYQGSLVTLKPLLAHRPGLQKAIDDALAKADAERSVYERAFILRYAIGRVREETGGEAAAAKKSLWDRLGGEKNVRKVVQDFMDLEHTDPKVDFFRGGKHKLNDEQLADLKQKIVEFVSQAAGGPLKYTGKSMKEAHAGMGITNAQFDALVADLKQALDKNGAKPADRDAVLEAVQGTRKDVVEEKKEGGKKEEKPAPKKEGGKPEPKKEPAGVKGNVTYKGKPVPGGTITFVPVKDGVAKTITGAIGEDGTYNLSKVPRGEYKIQIAPAGKDKPKFLLPAKYQSEKTSGLSVNVEAEAETHDIELKD